MRIIAVDDGPFKRGWRYTVLVSILHDESLAPRHVEARLASVDGVEATERVVDMLESMGVNGDAVVLVDSVTCCGFNYINGLEIHERTGLPVVHVYMYPLDLDAILRAVKKLDRWGERFQVVKEHWSRACRVDCRFGTLWFTAWGLEESLASRLLCRLQVYARTPLPLRNAHAVAAALVRRLFGLT